MNWLIWQLKRLTRQFFGRRELNVFFIQLLSHERNYLRIIVYLRGTLHLQHRPRNYSRRIGSVSAPPAGELVLSRCSTPAGADSTPNQRARSREQGAGSRGPGVPLVHLYNLLIKINVILKTIIRKKYL